MEPHINWTELKCAHCGDPASHVLVEDPYLDDDDDVLMQMAFCDDCHYVTFVGTLWVHKDPTWDATPDRCDADPEPH